MPTTSLPDDHVALEVETVKRATDKALLCVIEGEEVWIARSMIHDDSEVFDGEEHSTGTLIIPRWLAKTKRLI